MFVQKGTAPDGRLSFERVPVSVDEAKAASGCPSTHGLDKGGEVVTAGAILLSGHLSVTDR